MIHYYEHHPVGFATNPENQKIVRGIEVARRLLHATEKQGWVDALQGQMTLTSDKLAQYFSQAEKLSSRRQEAAVLLGKHMVLTVETPATEHTVAGELIGMDLHAATIDLEQPDGAVQNVRFAIETPYEDYDPIDGLERFPHQLYYGHTLITNIAVEVIPSEYEWVLE
jgi:hypothetical protein